MQSIRWIQTIWSVTALMKEKHVLTLVSVGLYFFLLKIQQKWSVLLESTLFPPHLYILQSCGLCRVLCTCCNALTNTKVLLSSQWPLQSWTDVTLSLFLNSFKCLSRTCAQSAVSQWTYFMLPACCQPTWTLFVDSWCVCEWDTVRVVDWIRPFDLKSELLLF